MSKRNISYVKPQDPSFLAKLKNQIGYKEGPTVETKKQRIENNLDSDDSDFGDRESEKPIVVVLKEGDLTAEEAAREEERITREAAEAPADLNQRIIFKKRNKDDSTIKTETLNSATTTTASSTSVKKNQNTHKATTATTKNKKTTKSVKVKSSIKLSFDNEDDEEEGDIY